MGRVYFGLEQYSFEGVDQEYLEFVFKVAKFLAGRDERHEIGVAVVGSEAMRRLNRQYRGTDATTNVLSFAYHEVRDPGRLASSEEEFYLGDIYLCYDEVLKEARAGRDEKEAFTYLLIHGILHLLGFHHRTAQEAETMEGLEEKILSTVLQ